MFEPTDQIEEFIFCCYFTGSTDDSAEQFSSFAGWLLILFASSFIIFPISNTALVNCFKAHIQKVYVHQLHQHQKVYVYSRNFTIISSLQLPVFNHIKLMISQFSNLSTIYFDLSHQVRSYRKQIQHLGLQAVLSHNTYANVLPFQFQTYDMIMLIDMV